MDSFKAILMIFCFPLVLAGINRNTSIACDGMTENFMLLKIGSNFSLDCGLPNFTMNSTDELKANFTKLSSNCSSEKSVSPTVAVVEDSSRNNSKIVRISFQTISWGLSGDYALIIKFRNVTLQKKIQFKVSDVPRIPTANRVNATSFMHYGDYVLALEATMPKQHKCSHPLKATYRFSYTSVGCSKSRSNVLCEVAKDTDGVSKDLVCIADKSYVCENSDLMNCKYNFTITGTNMLGSAAPLNILTPLLRYTVPALPARYLKLNPTGPRSLAFTWLKPLCRTIDFSYNVSYVASNSNSSYKSFFISSDNVRIKKNLEKLAPYTKYRVCVKVLNSELDAWSKELCLENYTLADVPSKAPEITDSGIRSMQQNNAKWECDLQWKVPAREFWNGKPYLQVEYFEVKTPTNHVLGPKLNINTSKYLIRNLEKGRQYAVRVSICTIGCNSSVWKSISFPVKNSSIVLYAILGVVIGVALIVLIAIIYICRRNRYKRLIEDPGTVTEVVPRPDEVHYEVVEEQVRPYQEAPPFNGRNQCSELESDEEHQIGGGRLEINEPSDYGAQQMDETELMPVRV